MRRPSARNAPMPRRASSSSSTRPVRDGRRSGFGSSFFVATFGQHAGSRVAADVFPGTALRRSPRAAHERDFSTHERPASPRFQAAPRPHPADKDTTRNRVSACALAASQIDAYHIQQLRLQTESSRAARCTSNRAEAASLLYTDSPMLNVDQPTPLARALEQSYRHGFVTDIESDSLPPGLDENVVREISRRKREPAFLLKWRLAAFERWLAMAPPDWGQLRIAPIDFQAQSYYSAPKSLKDRPKSLDDVDPKLLETYEKLNVPLHERARLAGVAVDAVFDSVSVGTTFREQLAEAGVIFCSFSHAVEHHPELIERYLGTVVPPADNFYAALNSAVFSDGSFVYVPQGVRCPMELSSYFRINAQNTGQFERTLIIAEPGSHVSYLEGCTAPQRDEHQLHAAVVELIAHDDAHIKYSTVQNWYPGDANGVGGIYNFVTKRGLCAGARSRIAWTQIETGSAITWKYPSVVLRGDESSGEFHSIAVSNHCQQADTGTKMIHLGRNTRSRIVSKGISAGRAQNSYRGLVRVARTAEGARNHTQCDSLLIGPQCGAHTFPYVESARDDAVVEHEATTTRISEDRLFYCQQRGIDPQEATALIVGGFCQAVLEALPMEFALEAKALLAVSLEGAVG
ncbi:ABC transporter [Burkholderia thailandensis E264]|uniref:ABC transporter n=2 Tax=Burkholderia thailandensis TaxID=57975 RepID=Q2SXM0_BURTA|nr:ABC transporter [Burkholderia thailandensis E264]